MSDMPMWLRFIEFITGWKVAYMTDREIRFKKPAPPETK